MSYILSEKAIDDLNSIWRYTAQNWSVAQADKYYHLIIAEIYYIATHFEFATDFHHFRKGYKYSKVKSHLIFFRKSKMEYWKL